MLKISLLTFLWLCNLLIKYIKIITIPKDHYPPFQPNILEINKILPKEVHRTAPEIETTSFALRPLQTM